MGLSKFQNIKTLAKLRPRFLKSYRSVIRNRKSAIENMVRFAYHNSEFYKALYDKNKIDINNFKFDDLPTLNKQTIIENYDAILTDSALSYKKISLYVERRESELLDGKYAIFSSGGSSGVRCHIPYDLEALYVINGLTIFRSGLFAPTLRQNIAFLGGVNHTNNTDNIKKNGLLSHQVKINSIPLFLSDVEVVKMLNEMKPTTIAAYSYMLRNLAVQKLGGMLKVSPKRLRCGGTSFTDDDRALIEKAFGILPYENYGACESLMVACGCKEHNGMHINEDMYYVEFLNEQREPDHNIIISHGVTVTNLYNKSFPLIRYTLDDNVIYTNDKCECGSSFRRIMSVTGRENDIFIFNANNNEVRVFSVDISNTILDIADIKEFRLVQREVNSLQINFSYISTSDFHSTRKTIFQRVSNFLDKKYECTGFELRVIPFDELRKDKLSGKLVPFITLCKYKYFENDIETEVGAE